MRSVQVIVLFLLSLIAVPVFAAHQAMLTWTASVTPNVTYNVYRIQCSTAQDNKLSVKHNATCTGTQTKVASNLAAVMFVDLSVQPGTSYEYYVTAVDSTANESVPSNTEVGTIAPLAPTNVQVGSH